jgi:hypothetical protein
MLYDDEANRKRGFLTRKERNALPLLKFFPPLPPSSSPADAPADEEAKAGIEYKGEMSVSFPTAHSLLLLVAHPPALLCSCCYDSARL